jgi:hypothetical protein
MWRRWPTARRAVERLWADDPDPDTTLAIKEEIDAALYRHDISYEPVQYYMCPWSAIYVVKRPVKIGGVRLHPLQEFTYDVGWRPGALRPSYRRILVGPFTASTAVRY